MFLKLKSKKSVHSSSQSSLISICILYRIFLGQNAQMPLRITCSHMYQLTWTRAYVPATIIGEKDSNSFSIRVSDSPLHNADPPGPKANSPGPPPIQGIHKVILVTEPNTLSPTPSHHSLLTPFRTSHHHWIWHLGSFCCEGIAWG